MPSLFSNLKKTRRAKLQWFRLLFLNHYKANAKFFFSSQSCWLKQTVSEGCEKRKFHKNKQPSQRRLSWKKLRLNLSHVKHFFWNWRALEDLCLNSTHPHSVFRKGRFDPASSDSQQKRFDETSSYDPAGFLVFASNDNWIPNRRDSKRRLHTIRMDSWSSPGMTTGFPREGIRRGFFKSVLQFTEAIL